MMKNFLQNKEFQLDEILFQSRNKDYGAYVLRNDADRILTKSMFIGVALFASVAALPFIVNSFKTVQAHSGDDGGRVLVNIVDPPVDVEVAPPVTPVVPPKKEVATFDSTVPTPTKNPTKEKPAATVDDYDKAVARTQDQDGEKKPADYQAPAVNVPAGPVVKPVEPVAPVKPTNSIETKVDVEANFVGGIDKFRNTVQSSFDGSDFEGSGEVLRTMITFVVEKDGSLTAIKADGKDAAFNREAEKTIRLIKGKWKPATIKGEAVRSYFRFPISMQFE